MIGLGAKKFHPGRIPIGSSRRRPVPKVPHLRYRAGYSPNRQEGQHNKGGDGHGPFSAGAFSALSLRPSG